MCSINTLFSQLYCYFYSLDLDMWINDPPSSSSDDEEEAPGQFSDIFSVASGTEKKVAAYEPTPEELSKVIFETNV